MKSILRRGLRLFHFVPDFRGLRAVLWGGLSLNALVAYPRKVGIGLEGRPLFTRLLPMKVASRVESMRRRSTTGFQAGWDERWGPELAYSPASRSLVGLGRCRWGARITPHQDGIALRILGEPLGAYVLLQAAFGLQDLNWRWSLSLALGDQRGLRSREARLRPLARRASSPPEAPAPSSNPSTELPSGDLEPSEEAFCSVEVFDKDLGWGEEWVPDPLGPSPQIEEPPEEPCQVVNPSTELPSGELEPSEEAFCSVEVLDKDLGWGEEWVPDPLGPSPQIEEPPEEPCQVMVSANNLKAAAETNAEKARSLDEQFAAFERELEHLFIYESPDAALAQIRQLPGYYWMRPSNGTLLDKLVLSNRPGIVKKFFELLGRWEAPFGVPLREESLLIPAPWGPGYSGSASYSHAVLALDEGCWNAFMELLEVARQCAETLRQGHRVEPRQEYARTIYDPPFNKGPRTGREAACIFLAHFLLGHTRSRRRTAKTSFLIGAYLGSGDDWVDALVARGTYELLGRTIMADVMTFGELIMLPRLISVFWEDEDYRACLGMVAGFPSLELLLRGGKWDMMMMLLQERHKVESHPILSPHLVGWGAGYETAWVFCSTGWAWVPVARKSYEKDGQEGAAERLPLDLEKLRKAVDLYGEGGWGFRMVSLLTIASELPDVEGLKRLLDFLTQQPKKFLTDCLLLQSRESFLGPETFLEASPLPKEVEGSSWIKNHLKSGARLETWCRRWSPPNGGWVLAHRNKIGLNVLDCALISENIPAFSLILNAAQTCGEESAQVLNALFHSENWYIKGGRRSIVWSARYFPQGSDLKAFDALLEVAYELCPVELLEVLDDSRLFQQGLRADLEREQWTKSDQEVRFLTGPPINHESVFRKLVQFLENREPAWLRARANRLLAEACLAVLPSLPFAEKTPARRPGCCILVEGAPKPYGKFVAELLAPNLPDPLNSLPFGAPTPLHWALEYDRCTPGESRLEEFIEELEHREEGKIFSMLQTTRPYTIFHWQRYTPLPFPYKEEVGFSSYWDEMQGAYVRRGPDPDWIPRDQIGIERFFKTDARNAKWKRSFSSSSCVFGCFDWFDRVIARWLYPNRELLKTLLTSRDEFGNTPLAQAIILGDIGLIDRIFTHCRVLAPRLLTKVLVEVNPLDEAALDPPESGSILATLLSPNFEEGGLRPLAARMRLPKQIYCPFIEKRLAASRYPWWTGMPMTREEYFLGRAFKKWVLPILSKPKGRLTELKRCLKVAKVRLDFPPWLLEEKTQEARAKTQGRVERLKVWFNGAEPEPPVLEGQGHKEDAAGQTHSPVPEEVLSKGGPGPGKSVLERVDPLQTAGPAWEGAVASQESDPNALYQAGKRIKEWWLGGYSDDKGSLIQSGPSLLGGARKSRGLANPVPINRSEAGVPIRSAGSAAHQKKNPQMEGDNPMSSRRGPRGVLVFWIGFSTLLISMGWVLWRAKTRKPATILSQEKAKGVPGLPSLEEKDGRDGCGPRLRSVPLGGDPGRSSTGLAWWRKFTWVPRGLKVFFTASWPRFRPTPR